MRPGPGRRAWRGRAKRLLDRRPPTPLRRPWASRRWRGIAAGGTR